MLWGWAEGKGGKGRGVQGRESLSGDSRSTPQQQCVSPAGIFHGACGIEEHSEAYIHAAAL